MTYQQTKTLLSDELSPLPWSEISLSSGQLHSKRFLDVVFSLSGLVFLWPFFLVIAVAIKLDSAGPAIFKQTRVGQNGVLFAMYKFRSMQVNVPKLIAAGGKAAAYGEFVHKACDDPRVTRVGRFLRHTSLDELPQLLNILRGEMSMVGPRPEIPWLVEHYEPWQMARFAVPQGLTGWWQINGRANKPMHMNTQDDLFYIENYSMWLDLFILLKTPLVVIRGQGAY